MDKYHVALSFAGEDRKYVERVAEELVRHGVKVFYDKFEDTRLWGKDLYSYLSDVYKNQAMYTVMFVSEAYKKKLWTNHERKSAQARAFAENKEYILPAMFDKKVEVPGLHKTTGYLDLRALSPEVVAAKIVQKLHDEGVILTVEDRFRYSDFAKADIDFSLAGKNEVTEIISALKSYNWYKQNPAVVKMLHLEWSKLSPDQIFVLGRNLYQCACGAERKSVALLKDLRRTLASLPLEAAEHLLNGMFYELYFDSKGVFRGSNLKSRCMSELFGIQTVEKYAASISFIQQVLEPYRDSLAVVPSRTPETVTVNITIAKKDPPVITKIKCRGRELLVSYGQAHPDSYSRAWRLSYREFTLETLVETLAETWHVPREQLGLETAADIPKEVYLRLPAEKTIGNLAG